MTVARDTYIAAMAATVERRLLNQRDEAEKWYSTLSHAYPTWGGREWFFYRARIGLPPTDDARQLADQQFGDKAKRELDDSVTLIELGEAEGDEAVVAEGEAALIALQKVADRAELEALLSGEADGNDCWVEVHAGAGGTEAQDWAEMLLRMYTRWAERRPMAG